MDNILYKNIRIFVDKVSIYLLAVCITPYRPSVNQKLHPCIHIPNQAYTGKRYIRHLHIAKFFSHYVGLEINQQKLVVQILFVNISFEEPTENKNKLVRAG